MGCPICPVSLWACGLIASSLPITCSLVWQLIARERRSRQTLHHPRVLSDFPLPCRADRGGLADMNRVQRRSSHNSHADRHVISVEQTAEWTAFEVRGESLPLMIIQSITKISHVEIPEIRPWQMPSMGKGRIDFRMSQVGLIVSGCSIHSTDCGVSRRVSPKQFEYQDSIFETSGTVSRSLT